MKTEIGLWIDHRQAVIVVITATGEETLRVDSHMEKHPRFSGVAQGDRATEDGRERRWENHLDSYYEEVIALIRTAESILIFGPGEAKGELAKRLEGKGLKGHIVDVETVDKMTDRQIAAKVRERFQV
jgi:hypothetical protein